MSYIKRDYKQNEQDLIHCLKTKGLEGLQLMCVVSGIPIAVAYDYVIDYIESERDRLLDFYDEDIK